MSNYISNISEIVKKLRPFLKEYLEEKGINTSKNFNCINPAHTDSSPSCGIFGTKDDPMVHCFGCGFSGDLIKVAVILDDLPGAGPEWIHKTLKTLATKYNIDFTIGDLTEEQIYELDTYRAYREASKLLKSSGFDKEDEKFKPLFQELEKRKWNENILKDMGIGIVPDYVEFRSALKRAGFSASFLDEIDLGRRDLFNVNNLVFTWFDEKNRPIGFTARNLLFETHKKEAEEQGRKYTEPKYNNQRTTGLKCNIFQKGKRFYGIDKAIKAMPPLYIFEGQADVITARSKGLYNCVAVAGSSMTTEHILTLKALGIRDIVLCFDGDEVGQTKLASILEDKLAGQQDLKVRVVLLKDNHDPDSFIREFGINAFLELPKLSAFEWRLSKYSEEEDVSTICSQMVPFIVNEPSPLHREQLCKILATRTGFSVKAITEELNILLNAKEYEKSRERSTILDRLQHDLKKNPSNAELILQETKSSLQELSRKYDNTALAEEDFITFLDEQKIKEEKKENKYEGFLLGPDLRSLEDALCGEWTKDVVLFMGGVANAGKSALLCKIAYAIATNNENTCVIYHTIDDSREQLAPRFVSIAEGSTELTINQVRHPNYWEKLVPGTTKRRSIGYQKVTQLAKEGRLIIKDVTHGGSLAFAEGLIQYYQDKYPDKQVIYFLDNFHKLNDYKGLDERIRFKAMSQKLKEIACLYHISAFCTVEYTKLIPGTKPNNNNVAESVQLEYDGNLIMHLFNEVGCLPESFTVCHTAFDWRKEQVYLPRVEVIIGKNKISDYKGSFFLDFWPASSDYRYVHQDIVLEAQSVMKEIRKEKDSKKSGYNGSSKKSFLDSFD